MTTSKIYRVISELPTHVSQPQRFLSESRDLDLAAARDWRDFTESQYRSKKDMRKVMVIQIL